MLRDGVAETTIDVSPASRAIRSKLVGQATTDALCPVPVGHVQVGKLGDARPKVRHDDAYPDEMLPVERSERDRACLHESLHDSLLSGDRMFADPCGIPRWRAPVAARSQLEPCSLLHVERFDPLGPIDVTNPRKIVGGKRSIVDRLSIHELVACRHARDGARRCSRPPARR